MRRREVDEAEIPRLLTRRCELVAVTASLASQILAGNYENARPAEGWPHADTSSAMAHVLAKQPALVWLIRLAGRTIGDCGTHGPVGSSGRVEIGYGLAEAFRGRGYATEVVPVLTQWLLGCPGVTAVVARAEVGNVASWKVLEKAGFVRVRESPTTFEYELVAQPAGPGASRSRPADASS